MASPSLTPSAIRIDMVERLAAAMPTVGVFDSREIDVDADEIPAVSVFSQGSEDANQSLAARVFRRTETVLVAGRVTGSDDAAMALAVDNMEAAILAAILTDMEWNVVCTAASISKGRSVSTSKRIGGVDIAFTLTYSPEYEIDLTGYDFERIAVTTEPTDPEGADVSTRVWELETS